MAWWKSTATTDPSKPTRMMGGVALGILNRLMRIRSNMHGESVDRQELKILKLKQLNLNL